MANVMLGQLVRWPGATCRSRQAGQPADAAAARAWAHAGRAPRLGQLGLCSTARRRRTGSCRTQATLGLGLSGLQTTSGAPEPAWAVLGLGQAMVDFSASVSDALLEDLGVTKGSRTLISHTQRSAVLSRLDGESYVCHAGGSLSNTLVALARLGGDTAHVSLAAAVGSDALGGFYRAQMRAAGVHVQAAPSPPSGTGTVVVLTTPDAQRTMLAYLPGASGASGQEGLGLGKRGAAAEEANLLLVEGYLLEQPDAVEAICEAIVAARRAGALVALTCADVGVVRAHRAAFRAVLEAGVDVLFANADEGMQLAHASDARDAAQALALGTTVAVVTDGSRGAYLATAGGACVVHAPPFWMPDAPVDTCGAGDAYAAGVLHGLLRGASLHHTGAFAARVAAAVIARHGARLAETDASRLAELFPTLAADPQSLDA